MERQLHNSSVRECPLISIHAPAKGATGIIQYTLVSSSNFNPRSREGSDLWYLWHLLYWLLFQSTLPRRERRNYYPYISVSSAISIHAPAKGATAGSSTLTYTTGISIHAPAKGATACLAVLFTAFLFQSTLPRRERQQYFTNPQVNIVKH